MTHQPKAYKKFVATAATATLVATAVAPVAASAASDFVDVNKNYEEAVNYLVEQGITEGMPGNKFGTDLNIKRGDAAVFIARALKLDTENAEDQNFSDLNNRVKGAVNAVVAEGIASGKGLGKFSPDDLITRQEMAKMLSNAYELTSDKDAPFTDVNKNWMKYVSNLYENGITLGKTEDTFLPNANLTRGEFALFMYRAETLDGKPEEPEVPATDGITSVKAINDTKLEVTFGKAIDEDLAVEIEKSGERFVVYHGGQTANTSEDDVIKSTTINFSEDRKTAEVILDEAPNADIKYTVALMDGDNNEVSTIVYKSTPTVLKEGAKQPSVDVNADQDKIILDFKTKMDKTALDADNYVVWENNRELGDLSEFVDTDLTDWVDATDKKSVEFKLAKNVTNGLLAGKTYKIKVKEDTVETDDGKELSSNQRTITFKTPSVSQAEPTAKIARIKPDDANKLQIVFDKDLADEASFNKAMITVKKPGGDTLTVSGVSVVQDSKIIELAMDEELDRDLTYTIELPANGVNNAYFANASNKATSNLKAQAQKDIEIKSMTAKFIAQVDAKDKADLLLTFDQRPGELNKNKVVLKEGSNTWDLTKEAELYYGDSSGKTMIIKDVKEAFGIPEGKFKSDKTYTVEVEVDGVRVDAGENAKTNQEKLKATANGISVSGPIVDTVTLKSADEIEIEFKEEIDASNIKASDVRVAGYEKYSNGNFSDQIALQGDSQLKLSASGKKVTIRTANKDVKFVTSTEAVENTVLGGSLFIIEENTLTTKGNKISNEELDAGELDYDLVDRAAPVLVGGVVNKADEVTLTFTESVVFKDVSEDEKTASQFTVKNASKNAYGVSVADENTNKLTVTFNENDTFKKDLDLSKVELKYAKNTNVLLKDKKGNEVANDTLKGLKGEGSYWNDNSGVTKPGATGNPNVTAKVTTEVEGLDAAEAVAAKYTFNVTKEAKAGDKVTIENVADGNVEVTLDGTENLTGVATKIVTTINGATGPKYTASNSGATITLTATEENKGVIADAPTATVKKAENGTLEVSKVNEKVKGAGEVIAKAAEFEVEITKGAEKKGTIVVAAPGADKVEVEVEEGDTPSEVAEKIKTAFADNDKYTVTANAGILTFTAEDVGKQTGTVSITNKK